METCCYSRGKPSANALEKNSQMMIIKYGEFFLTSRPGSNWNGEVSLQDPKLWIRYHLKFRFRMSDKIEKPTNHIRYILSPLMSTHI